MTKIYFLNSDSGKVIATDELAQNPQERDKWVDPKTAREYVICSETRSVNFVRPILSDREHKERMDNRRSLGLNSGPSLARLGG